MTSFLKKHSALIALLILLPAAYAAPYLLPSDPDSAVFRNGTLSALFLFSAWYPVRHALRTHSLRSILYGCVFAAFFSLCLGLGSELSFYGYLLPGMGSLLRRLAVPCMITPLLGTLFSYVFSRVGSFVPGKPLCLPWWMFFVFLTACYLPVFLAFYPGVIAYDFEHEIRQFTTGIYEAAHPVFHTLFLGLLYRLGEALGGSMTAGAAMYSIVQLLLFASILAWVCSFLSCRLPWPATLLFTLCTALLPFHSVLAVSTSKDPLFGSLCAMLCALLFTAIEDPVAFLTNRRRVIHFIACCLVMALIRRNGVFAIIPASLVLFIVCKHHRRKAAAICTATLVLCLCAPSALNVAVSAHSAPSTELMSVPCQQLMRVAARGDIPQEEYDEIAPWFSNAIARYRSHCADPAKGGNFDLSRYQEDPDEFLSMYFKYAKKYPRIYLEAFLENCAGLWNPDDVSHSNSLAGESYDYVYLITEYMYKPERYAIQPHSLLPGLKNVLYDFTHHSKHQQLPVLAQLFCPATYTFLLLLATLFAFYKKQYRLSACTLPLWGIWTSLLFSAGIFVRYAYPLMAAVPVALLLILFAKPTNTAHP